MHYGVALEMMEKEERREATKAKKEIKEIKATKQKMAATYTNPSPTPQKAATSPENGSTGGSKTDAKDAYEAFKDFGGVAGLIARIRATADPEVIKGIESGAIPEMERHPVFKNHSHWGYMDVLQLIADSGLPGTQGKEFVDLHFTIMGFESVGEDWGQELRNRGFGDFVDFYEQCKNGNPL